MRPYWYLIFFFDSVLGRRQQVFDNAPKIEKEHDPLRYTSPVSLFLQDTEDRVPFSNESPDFRLEEPSFLPHSPLYIEQNRPYRMSPHHKRTATKWRKGENMHTASCYCNTVYKRLTLLAGCAVLTARHILTTATATHLIMKGRYHYPHLEGILGVWYDSSHDVFNSSMYLTPAQIFYHPRWHYPEDVNMSHPFSFTFDLAVYTGTHNVYGWYWDKASTTFCSRASSHPRDQHPPTPTNELWIIVGFQFMYAYKRKPMPWFKYGIRTGRQLHPCPKTEWGWYLCIPANYLRYGIESGALLHRTFQGRSWRNDGLVGLGLFSTPLRALEMIHYFTILDTHVVLDFLYDSYRLNRKPVWTDKRFVHPRGKAPYSTGKYRIPDYHVLGKQWGFEPPFD